MNIQLMRFSMVNIMLATPKYELTLHSLNSLIIKGWEGGDWVFKTFEKKVGVRIFPI